jgi:hypothetical protein
VRTTFDFDFVTTATPEQVVELMTDFSANRPNRWPASSAEAFEVYRIGDSDADIREGQDFPKLWATWHYDWTEPNSVTLMIVESDALEPGGFMSLTAAPHDGGSAVHGVWQQTSKSLRGLAAVTMMRLFGSRFLSSYYKKVYDAL